MKPDRRTLILATILAVVPGAPLPARQGGGPFAEVFDGVPLTHPAYATCHFLLAVMRIPTGYSPDTFKTERQLTRYEFAVVVQKVLGCVKLCVADIREGQPSRVIPKGEPGAAPPTPSLDFTDFRRVFTDRDRLEQLLTWLRPLVQEFARELEMLGQDMGKAEREMRDWKRSAESIIRKARAIK